VTSLFTTTFANSAVVAYPSSSTIDDTTYGVGHPTTILIGKQLDIDVNSKASAMVGTLTSAPLLTRQAFRVPFIKLVVPWRLVQ
jgi:hypothetical protein